MNVLIIEDEVLAAERLSRLLLEIDPDILIAGVQQSISGAVSVLQQDKQPHLILADIELADGNCFEIFKRVPVTSAVIFTTAYNEYALEAFSANSIDYLLKPIRKEALEKSLQKFYSMKQQFATSFFAEHGDRLQQEIWKGSATTPVKNNFLVKIGQRLIPVGVEEIAYFFADGRLVYLVTWDKKKMIIDHSLEELETMLQGQDYFRANRAFLVHRKSIQKCRALLSRKLKLDVLPEPDREVLVSKERSGPFKNWLAG
jgi:DNA-binding LytR/AlgR family response regulator